MSGPPDILLIVLDTQRVDRLSCYGFPLKTSPFLDSFAGGSTLFTHAISPAQWTVPAHASMFTGLHPSEHSVLQMDSIIPEEIAVLSERLQKGSYFTAGFSNNPLVGVLNNGLTRGFQRFINYGGLLTRRSASDLKNTPSLNGSKQRLFLQKGLSCAQNKLANSHFLNRIFFSSLIFPIWQTALMIRGNIKGNTRQALRDASQFLIQRPSLPTSQPIFCFVNLMGTHVPYYPSKSALQQFVPQLLGTPTLQGYLWRFNTRLYQRLGPNIDLLPEMEQALIGALYNAEIWTQDQELGGFFKTLQSATNFNQMFILITADHGELLGEKHLLGHAFSAHEPLVHVPLLIQDPGGELEAGRTVSQTVSTRRIFHTILSAAGLGTSREEKLSLARNHLTFVNEDFVITEAVPIYSTIKLINRSRPGVVERLGYDQPERAIYQGPYKLFTKGDRATGLYAIHEDSYENDNLIDKAPEAKKTLIEQLENYRQPGVTTNQPGPHLLGGDEVIFDRLKKLGYLEE